ncbi:MAG: hypothetical protein Q4G43_09625 [Mobilicoccus sp.]|nr:hypothetical protein [Mobilicoccus sp.]
MRRFMLSGVALLLCACGGSDQVEPASEELTAAGVARTQDVPASPTGVPPRTDEVPSGLRVDPASIGQSTSAELIEARDLSGLWEAETARVAPNLPPGFAFSTGLPEGLSGKEENYVSGLVADYVGKQYRCAWLEVDADPASSPELRAQADEALGSGRDLVGVPEHNRDAYAEYVELEGVERARAFELEDLCPMSY